MVYLPGPSPQSKSALLCISTGKNDPIYKNQNQLLYNFYAKGSRVFSYIYNKLVSQICTWDSSTCYFTIFFSWWCVTYRAIGTQLPWPQADLIVSLPLLALTLSFLLNGYYVSFSSERNREDRSEWTWLTLVWSICFRPAISLKKYS
jgi:hypothetical protein